MCNEQYKFLQIFEIYIQVCISKCINDYITAMICRIFGGLVKFKLSAKHSLNEQTKKFHCLC